jgi:hypothetical protein
MTPPTGPDVKFPPSETYTFDQLTDRLIELEKKHGYSSLEMFRQYIRSDYNEEETMEDWFSFLFLYLGTDEVRYWSSP